MALLMLARNLRYVCDWSECETHPAYECDLSRMNEARALHMSVHTPTHCNTQQRTATDCNRLQQTALHMSVHEQCEQGNKGALACKKHQEYIRHEAHPIYKWVTNSTSELVANSTYDCVVNSTHECIHSTGNPLHIRMGLVTLMNALCHACDGSLIHEPHICMRHKLHEYMSHEFRVYTSHELRIYKSQELHIYMSHELHIRISSVARMGWVMNTRQLSHSSEYRKVTNSTYAWVA